MSRLWFRLAVGVLVALVSLASPVLAGASRLVVWTQFGETTAEYKAFRQLADEFTNQTGTAVELVPVPWDDFIKKIGLAFPAGQGGDLIVTWPHDWIGQWAKQGLLMPLPDDVLGNERSQYPASSLQAVTYDGKLYGLPVTVESVALVYNKKLVPEPPATWAELVAMARRLNKGDQHGFLMPLLEQYHTYGIVRGFGGYVFKWTGSGYDYADIGLNNEGAVQAFSFLRNLYLTERIFPPAVIDRSTQHAVTTGKFEEGKVGMQINGPWVIPGARKAGIDVGVALLPLLPNGKRMVPFTGVQFVGINAYTRNKEAALTLAKMYASRLGQEVLFLATGRVPVRRDVLQLDSVKKDPFVAVWAKQAELGEPMPNIPEMQAVWKPWGDAMDVIVPGKGDVKPMMDKAVSQIRQGIERMRR